MEKVVQVPNVVSVSKFSGKLSKAQWIMFGVGFFIILLGVVTGYLLSGKKSSIASGLMGTQVGSKVTKTSTTAGTNDESTFKDSAEGVLENGGINGEGTHHLTRDGGPTQTAYLTSTVIDLGSFVGKKVKVWGQTIDAKHAGWLMDVGKVQVVE